MYFDIEKNLFLNIIIYFLILEILSLIFKIHFLILQKRMHF